MMNRRNQGARAMAVVLAAVFVAVGPATGAGAAPLEKELVVVASGGAFEQLLKEQFYEPFSRKAGVTVRPVAASAAEQWAKVKAMSATGRVEWDIVTVEPYDLFDTSPNRRWLADLGDCGAMPAVAMHGVPGACKRYAVLRTIGGGVIAYNATRFPAGHHPRSWADFWDVDRFPGPRMLPNAGMPWWVLAAALLADGVSPDRLVPMDLDRAFRKLDAIKPHVRVWWKTGDQSQQAMRDGEVALAMMWSGRVLSLKTQGVPVDIEWNQAIRNTAYWGVLAGAPHPEAARAFVDFFMGRPEAHLAYGRRLFYDTSNRRALQGLPEGERLTRATHPANWERMVEVDGQAWVASNRDRILERWNAWLAQ